MDTKKLRQKILDLAIHGKLVPQDPNDEPASVLLERIRAEKEQLIKEGKIKAPKKSKSAGDTSHYPKDGPWELPEGWEWTTLDTIARFSGGKTPSMDDRSNWENGKHLWITSKDMKLEAICDSLIKLSDTGLQGMTIHHPGTILMVNRSGILRRTLPLGVLQKDATINQDLKAIIPYIIDLTPYLFFCLKAFEPIILQDYKKAGTTVDNINFDLFVTIPIPLPPIQEQGRIVQSIQSWMKRIVVIEESNDEIFDTIDSTKSKILELAINGKLVPQNPSDEPAIELIKRINPGFTPSHNLHYEGIVPAGWQLCQLSDLFKITMGQSPDGSSLNHKSGIEFHQGKICFTEKYLTESGIFTSCPTKCAEPNSLLCCVRAPVGVFNITTRRICIGRGLCSLSPLDLDVDIEYWFYALCSLTEYYEGKATGSTFKAISGDIIRNTVIAVPPKMEQKRICEQITRLFSVLKEVADTI